MVYLISINNDYTVSYILVMKRQALINLLIVKNRNCGRNLL